MRFLKNRIRMAQAYREGGLQNNNENQVVRSVDEGLPAKDEEGTQAEPKATTPEVGTKKKTRTKKHERESPSKAASPTKNIVINYGGAIIAFAASSLAEPYLEPHLKKEGVTLKQFVDFVQASKGKTNSIQGFRSLLIISETDNETTKTLKQIFAKISEVFIKYFSVNWIMHGRVTHKLVYLKYRCRILRRIQNPEYFTYIK